jgi:DNA-directed RNA polymerase subunit RPC12/RpoP
VCTRCGKEFSISDKLEMDKKQKTIQPDRA